MTKIKQFKVMLLYLQIFTLLFIISVPNAFAVSDMINRLPTFRPCLVIQVKIAQ